MVGLQDHEGGEGEEEVSSGPSLVSTYTGQGWKYTEMPRLVTDSGGVCGGQSWVGLTAVSCQMSLLIHTMARMGTEQRSDREGQGSSGGSVSMP